METTITLQPTTPVAEEQGELSTEDINAPRFKEVATQTDDQIANNAATQIMLDEREKEINDLNMKVEGLKREISKWSSSLKTPNSRSNLSKTIVILHFIPDSMTT